MKNILFIFITLFLFSCSSNNIQFEGEAAFAWLEKQCDFGPRNPGSQGYDNCKEFLIEELNGYADTVFTQNFTYTELRENDTFELDNIIAQFKSNSTMHALLGAHWDTRPWADMDPNPDNYQTPILGANDGASGVAVLLELAKMFASKPPPINITVVLFDGEDMGISGVPNSFAQGSKYFAENLPIEKPDYGIILDMIGDAILEISIERNSYRIAPELVNELWTKAEELKLNAFKNKLGYEMYDDHIPLWEIAEIPTIDIIDFNYPNQSINYWHTLQDIPQNCSPNSLEQVGSLIATHIYSQK